MRKLKFVLMILAVVLVVAMANHALAAGGTLTKFNVTLDQLDISRNGGRTWVNVFNVARNFDMLALSGGNMAQWFTGVQVPAGTYNMWRVHVTYSEMAVTGDVDHGNPSDSSTVDEWDSGTCNIVVDANGNTTATFNFDAEGSFVVHGPTDIELDPIITIK